MLWKADTGKNPWKLRTTDEHGVKRQWSFPTSRLRAEFHRDLEDKKARVRAGLAVERGPITFDALCDLYLANYTANSKPWLEGRLRVSRERWGSLPIHLLRPEQIGAWLHTELPHSPKGKRHILTAMRQVLNAAVEWDYITKSPARPSAVKPPALDEPDVRPLESWAEVLSVADAAGPHYSPLIRFACATGLRPQEWARLEWRDIDRPGQVMNVRGTKTEAARRAVVLSTLAMSALDDVTRRIDNNLVFTTPTGREIQTEKWGQKVWREALALAGLEHRPSYQMRHTYATLALAQGIPLEWISGQMGHADIEITRRHYARFVKRVDDRMRALLDQMESEDERTSDLHHT